uniref:Uncharacterized protein n=1 Tax=Anguilla anguilla TaxID=7936 RepID=A0A0E9SRB8_ANGAN
MEPMTGYFWEMAEILLVDKGTVDRFQLLFAAKPCCQLEDCHIFSPLNGKHIVHVSFSCESHFFGGTRAAMFMSCQCVKWVSFSVVDRSANLTP